MARKKQDPPDEAAEPLDFERAVAELEAIVSSMEEEQLPLEELVSGYEKGVKLLARCEAVLRSARERLLTINERELAGKSPETTDSLDEEEDLSDDDPATPDATDDDDDIRLF